jgi:hypothetical protein
MHLCLPVARKGLERARGEARLDPEERGTTRIILTLGLKASGSIKPSTMEALSQAVESNDDELLG